MELLWVDFVFKDFYSVNEYYGNVILVAFKSGSVLVDIDFAQLELAGAPGREDGCPGLLTEVTARPAVDNDDCPMHRG